MSRHNRWLKTLLSLWQILALSGLLGGLIWAMTRPNWILRDSNQILIEGNRLLPRQSILSFLGLTYPKWLLQISPDELSQTLESHPPIADVTVTRQLFPSGLVVKVQERVPVAIAINTSTNARNTPDSKANIGFLDSEGAWIPQQSYPPQVRQFIKPPNLKVIGVPESYRSYWTDIYQAVSDSSIKITEIDCRDPANLILKTQLGIVHLGSYSSKLTQQFKVLEQMRQLTKQLNPSQIDYIDLKNPASPPIIQTRQNTTSEIPLQQSPTQEKTSNSQLRFVKKDTP